MRAAITWWAGTIWCQWVHVGDWSRAPAAAAPRAAAGEGSRAAHWAIGSACMRRDSGEDVVPRSGFYFLFLAHGIFRGGDAVRAEAVNERYADTARCADMPPWPGGASPVPSAPLRGQGGSQGTATAATVVHTSPDCNSLAHALAAAAVAPGPVVLLGAIVLATRTFALDIAAAVAAPRPEAAPPSSSSCCPWAMFADNVPSGGVNGSRPNGSAIDLLVVPIRGGVRGGLDEKVCPQADERCGNSTDRYRYGKLARARGRAGRAK